MVGGNDPLRGRLADDDPGIDALVTALKAFLRSLAISRALPTRATT